MLKVNQLILLLIFVAGFTGSSLAQDLPQLSTLFTTPQERQVINTNRYKVERVNRVVEQAPQVEAEAIRELIREEISVSYKISGVSTDSEGSKTAWINGQSYQSGDTMDDGSKVRIKNTSVIITTVDGKNHRAVSGEVLDLTYLKTIGE